MDVLPPVCGAYENGVDQFEAAFLGEEARQDFGTASFLDKASFNQVGGAHIFPEPPGQVEMGQKGIEVFGKDLTTAPAVVG